MIKCKRPTKWRTCQTRSPSERMVLCSGRVFLRPLSKIHGLAEKPNRGGKHGKESNGSPGETIASNHHRCKTERPAYQGLVCRTRRACAQLLQVAAENERYPADRKKAEIQFQELEIPQNICGTKTSDRILLHIQNILVELPVSTPE